MLPLSPASCQEPCQLPLDTGWEQSYSFLNPTDTPKGKIFCSQSFLRLKGLTMGNQVGRYWTLVIVLLVVAIAVGGLMLLLKGDGKDRLEIVLSQPTPASEQEVEVYVDGAVANPGFYLLEGANTIEDVLTQYCYLGWRSLPARWHGSPG